MTEYLPMNTPPPFRLWRVEALPLAAYDGPLLPHALIGAHTDREACCRMMAQALSENDLPPDGLPYVWSVEPWDDGECLITHTCSIYKWTPRSGTYYD